MDTASKSALRGEAAFVCQNLIFTSELESHLIQGGLFTPEMTQEIKRLGTRESIALELVKQLERRGPDAYHVFCCILDDTNFEFIAERLRHRQGLEQVSLESQNETRNTVEMVLAENKHVTVSQKQRLCESLTTAHAHKKVREQLETERINCKELREEVVRIEANFARIKKQLEEAREGKATAEAKLEARQLASDGDGRQLSEVQNRLGQVQTRADLLYRTNTEQAIEIKVRMEKCLELQDELSDMKMTLRKMEIECTNLKDECTHLKDENRKLELELARSLSRMSSKDSEGNLKLKLTRMNCRLEQHGRRLADETTVNELITLLEENIAAVNRYIEFLKTELTQATAKLELLQQQNKSLASLLEKYRDDEISQQMESFIWMTAQESEQVHDRMISLNEQLEASQQTERLLSDKLNHLRQRQSLKRPRRRSSHTPPPPRLAPLSTVSATALSGESLAVTPSTSRSTLVRSPKGRYVRFSMDSQPPHSGRTSMSEPLTQRSSTTLLPPVVHTLPRSEPQRRKSVKT